MSGSNSRKKDGPSVSFEDIPKNMPYDPDQDRDVVRGIRSKYRAQGNALDEFQSNTAGIETEELTNTVIEADELFAKVKAPQEATLDSALLMKVSNMSVLKARAMKSDAGGFDVDDFVSKLITFMGGRKHAVCDGDDDGDDDDGSAPLDWDKIGRKALAKSRRVPAMEFMLGPLSTEIKKRNPVKRAKLEKNKAEEKRPQELKEDDIQRSENETTKNVLILEKLLEKFGKPINFFTFIVNPNDFGQSVENLFYLSFLIRDAKCALDIESGEPLIYLCQPPTDEDYSEGLKKRQIVMQLDMATWKRAIDVFNITEPTIPQRPPSKFKTADQWYG